MPIHLTLAAGAIVLGLILLLVLRRRGAGTAAQADATDAPTLTGSSEGASLDDRQWRAPRPLDRLRARLRGGRKAARLMREPHTAVRLRRDGSAVCLVRQHDGVYGDRPNWEHISELTRAMGKAERCWPGANLSGLLEYTDKTVPVEYSPRLVADLEDDTAPAPRASAPV